MIDVHIFTMVYYIYDLLRNETMNCTSRLITTVANVGFMLHYIGGDYSFTSDIILLVHVSNGRRVVMVTRGST